jgi:Uma2 family endonuclease
VTANTRDLWPHESAINWSSQDSSGLLRTLCPQVWEVVPDVRLRLDQGPYQRDLAILDSGALHEALAGDAVDMAPKSVRMAVEVVSPSSFSDDRAKKPNLYAVNGIPTYVRIELLGPNAPYIYFYKIGKRFYHLAAAAHAGQTMRIDEPVVLEFDPAVLTGASGDNKVSS